VAVAGRNKHYSYNVYTVTTQTEITKKLKDYKVKDINSHLPTMTV